MGVEAAKYFEKFRKILCSDITPLVQEFGNIVVFLDDIRIAENIFTLILPDNVAFI
jgi:hypothetical protein